MMFWKKKKPPECEHQWVYIERENNVFDDDYEVYCPKCDTSKYYNYEKNALACVKRSELRNQYLKEQETGRLSDEHTSASGSDQL